MSIKMSRYVRIISAVTGATSVAQQQLIGRRFTTNPLVPIDKIVSVGPGGADEYFGVDSPEAQFARQYFSYISPSPANQAPELQFCAYVSSPRQAQVYGYKTNTSLEEFQEVLVGVIRITIGGSDHTVTEIDLSEETSLEDVANAVSVAVNSEIGPDSEVIITFDPLEGAFKVESATVGPDKIIITAAQGQDLGTMMGLAGAQAISSPGSDEQTPLEAFQAAEQITDSFGTVSWGSSIDLDDALPVADYVSGENVKYQVYWSVNSSNAEEWSEALIDTASNGLILNGTEGEYKEALPQAVMAATDYDRTNSAINYMFRQSGLTLTSDVTTDAMADFYDNLRVNYYGQTATAGQNISFFQRGYLMGGPTAPVDMSVHANEQWLKAYVRSQLMSLFLATRRIPANLDGRGMVLAITQGAVNKALNNGTIIVGKTLTDLQKVAILQGTNDPLAWHDVQNNGYWMDAEITQETGSSGITEYICKYTLFYSKGDAVRKIEGSHNLV